MIAEAFARLVNARPTARGKWMARCPAHNDRGPSLSIRQGERGVLVYCMAQCSTDAVLSALGLRRRDLFNGPSPTPAQLEAKAREDVERDAQAAQQKLEHARVCGELLKWERVRDELGARLALLSDDNPAAKELERLFHLSARRANELDIAERESRLPDSKERIACERHELREFIELSPDLQNRRTNAHAKGQAVLRKSV